MAKQHQQRMSDGQGDSSGSLLESRAWELFVANVPVGAALSHTPEHLAEECFKAAAVFEAVADQHKEPKG